MKAWLALSLAAPALLGSAPLTLVAPQTPQVVFAGQDQTAEVRFRNGTPTNIAIPLRFRLLQASSATAMPLNEVQSWKHLSVLAGQTVLESVAVRFPAVRAETRFLIQWLDDRGHALGATAVIAVPTNLLHELRRLSGDQPLGVLDPQDQLKPLLRTFEVDFTEVALGGIDRFRGRLAIVCVPESREEELRVLNEKLKKCREAGVNILCFRRAVLEEALPTAVCQVRSGMGALVLADSQLLSGLEESPARQRTLISLARLTVKAEPFELTQP